MKRNPAYICRTACTIVSDLDAIFNEQGRVTLCERNGLRPYCKGLVRETKKHEVNWRPHGCGSAGALVKEVEED